jgi:hypothetical protein
MDDEARLDAVENGLVIVGLIDGGWRARCAGKSGLDEKSWHASASLRNAIDRALEDLNKRLRVVK